MTKRRLRFRTIRGRTTAILIAASVLALVAYTLGVLFSNWWIGRFYLSEDAQDKRNDALAEQLQKDVQGQGIRAADSAALQDWIQKNELVTLVVSLPESPVEIDVLGAQELPNDQDLPAQLRAQGYSDYDVAFADGTYHVSLVESSELRLYQLGRYVSLAIAFGVLMVIMLLHSRWITRRIARLSEEVNAVSHGGIEHEIVPMHRDEISSLAQDVEHMRSTIIQRTRSEQSALQANSELITNLSHDIRNPLTALIGYLELMEMDMDALPEADRDYLRACLEKSYRIRDLTGEMFRYFLIYGKEAQAVELEDYDAQVLLWQLLGECAEDLIARGFQVQTRALETPCTLRTDAHLLKRVVDNLSSNIIKYADPDAPVIIEAREGDGRITVTFTNRIAQQPNPVESNHVGLRICSAIVRLLNGVFETENNGCAFKVSFTLPLKPE